MAETRRNGKGGSVRGTIFLFAWALASAATAATPRPPPVEPGAPDGGFDWVQLDTGEWLPGEFDRMQDEIVYFDSEEFDDQKFDWDDVIVLVSSGIHTVRFDGRDPIMGSFEMRNGMVFVDTGATTIAAEKARVLSVIPGGEHELDYWSWEGKLGVTAQEGNTKQSDIAVGADARRDSTLTRWDTNYQGHFGSSDDDTTIENHRLLSEFDYFLTLRLYLNLATAEWYKDRFQNIRTRATTGAGVGYKIVDRKIVDWEVGTGAAYQFTSYQSVERGESDSASDAAALFATALKIDLPHGTDWDTTYRVALVATDLHKTSHHAESAFDFDIWGPVDLEVALIFDRIEHPRAESGGDRPKSNDYRLTVSFEIEY